MFLAAIEKFGVKKADQVQTVDIFEAKNPVAVVNMVRCR